MHASILPDAGIDIAAGSKSRVHSSLIPGSEDYDKKASAVFREVQSECNHRCWIG